MTPKVSIVIPCRNESYQIVETLYSILTTPTNISYEVIIVDDGSTDGCCNHIRNLLKIGNVKVLTNPVSLGLCRTKNIGALNSNGEYICFCDAHIYVEDYWLDRMIECFNFDTNVGMVTCGIADKNNPNPDEACGYGETLEIEQIDIRFSGLWLPKSENISEIPFCAGGCMMVLKEVFEYIGGFDDNFEIWGSEDMEISIKTWLFGYKILVTPFTKIYHVFRNVNPNPVTQDHINANILRLIYMHFNERRIEKVENLFKSNPNYQLIKEKIELEGIFQKREKYFSTRKYDDNWFFKKFNINFENDECDFRKENSITEKLNNKITIAQIDPFSYCNSKCWYCPVRYIPNPKEAINHMSIELFRKIIVNLDEEKKKNNGIVDKNFDFIYTAHYNEILLYKYFKEMLDILREFKIKTMILSNGIPLTFEKTNIISQYPDVVIGICLNIPAFDSITWSKRTGINENLFPSLINNIRYAIDHLPNLVNNNQFSIQINGINENSFIDCGGKLEKGILFPIDIDLNFTNGELKCQSNLAKNLFPEIIVYEVSDLIDRVGILSDIGIMSNKEFITNNLKKDKTVVNGCNNGDRIYSWLHINSLGQVFTCCNDYNFEYIFGDFATQTLEDFWYSDLHKQTIQKSFNEICTKCIFSKWC